MPMQYLFHVKVNFKKKNPVFPIEKFLFLVLARNTIMLPHLTIHYPIICQMVAYGRLKKESFKLLALKVFAVTYEVVAYKRF